MARNNVLYLVIGALVVAVAVLGYQLYEAKKDPKGVQINLGERGISIETTPVAEQCELEQFMQKIEALGAPAT